MVALRSSSSEKPMQGDGLETAAGSDFWKASSSDAYQPPDQRRGVPMPPLADTPPLAQQRIALPDIKALDGTTVDIRALVAERRSVRAYSEEPLQIEELSWLLWCTQGVTRLTNDERTMRTVPSAGARHAFETFLLLNNVAGVPQGLYQYCSLSHELAAIATDVETVERIIEAFRNIHLIESSAATFIWCAVAYRMTWKFGERGYRYLLLDAGHVCQNLYLAAETVGCGVCAVGSFDDAELNGALGVDGVERFVVYAGTVGRKEGSDR
jgi:SagB-type dehydrogenase family enzyme